MRTTANVVALKPASRPENRRPQSSGHAEPTPSAACSRGVPQLFSAGAYGYFEATDDLTPWCSAQFLAKAHKRTPVFMRFTVPSGGRHVADGAREIYGIALKLHTEQGVYDIIGGNMPLFFIRDPAKYESLVRSQKTHSVLNRKDPNRIWDFLSRTPEATSLLTLLFSDDGTPRSFRHMDAYGAHVARWVNQAGETVWVKYHFETEQGKENIDLKRAMQRAADNPNYTTWDLLTTLNKGGTAAWRMLVQIMPDEDAAACPFDPCDPTRIWPVTDYPLIPAGRLVLNRNPEDYARTVGEASFSPAHVVPGIGLPANSMLPYLAAWHTNTRNATPLHLQPQLDGLDADNPHMLKATTEATRPHDDYAQAGAYFRALSEDAKTHLATNIVHALQLAERDIQLRQLAHFTQADNDYGLRIARGLNLATMMPADVDAAVSSALREHSHDRSCAI
ncbi:MAG: catalase [Gammaproteobacteria bacterium]|nr:catalase [Gammaproteobacteria bacterium]